MSNGSGHSPISLGRALFALAPAAGRAHLADPGTVFTMYTVVQVWGRTRA